MVRALAVLVVFAGAAHADSEHWKDGCPAFFAPEDPPRSLSDLPTHTGVASFGALPELDSPLGPSRIAFGTWQSQLFQDRPAHTTPGLWGGEAVLHVASTAGVFATVTLATIRGLESDPTYARWGNLQGFVGYRRASYVLGSAFRLGVAFRVGEGGNDGAHSDRASVQKREELAALSPFHEAQFGYERPITATFESRFEMVGCHAPFVDLRADAATWQPSDSGGNSYDRAFVLPLALAFGGYVTPRNALYVQFAFEYRRALVYSHITRVGIGWELRPDQLAVGPFGDAHLGVQADAFTGDNAAGWQLVATLAWQFGWKGRLQ